MSTIEEAKLRHPSSGQLQEIIATSVTKAYNSGVKHERERIIKLLELPNGWHETVYVAGEGDEHFASSCVTCLNIGLIKGEQK